MAIMFTYRHPGLTPQVYDTVRKAVNWEQRPPAGAIFHGISFDEGGATEVNVWETQETYDAYIEDRLRPAVQAHGAQFPAPKVAPLYKLAVGASAKPYQLPEPQPA
jgi:hypothetical protein